MLIIGEVEHIKIMAGGNTMFAHFAVPVYHKNAISYTLNTNNTITIKSSTSDKVALDQYFNSVRQIHINDKYYIYSDDFSCSVKKNITLYHIDNVIDELPVYNAIEVNGIIIVILCDFLSFIGQDYIITAAPLDSIYNSSICMDQLKKYIKESIKELYRAKETAKHDSIFDVIQCEEIDEDIINNVIQLIIMQIVKSKLYC